MKKGNPPLVDCLDLQENRGGKSLLGRITPVRSFAFPPQGEGGPLCVPCGYAVDEVPERSFGFPSQGEAVSIAD